MKKLILIIIISLSCPLFSEQIHFRLANNQDKYDFIKNSEFYFDTENDNIMFARDWMFSKASVDLMYFENLHRIYITDIELFDQNDNFPDSIKNSIWTLKYYFDDVKSNKNSLFKNEPFKGVCHPHYATVAPSKLLSGSQDLIIANVGNTCQFCNLTDAFHYNDIDIKFFYDENQDFIKDLNIGDKTNPSIQDMIKDYDLWSATNDKWTQTL